MQALGRGGYRVTPQREAVLRVLAATDEHPDIEQIYLLARQQCRSTSRATVYNTVGVLQQLGEVLELEFASAGNRYDARSPEPPPHLVCTRCGGIDDFDPDGPRAGEPARLRAEHPHYQAVAELDPATRQALLTDLETA